jgi:tetratricopeptide (TPR) repeat protein
LYITVLACFCVGTAAAQPPAGDPDALYRQRGELARAREAAAIWRARAEANASDFESWWKLARACYWLGGRGPQAGRKQDLEQGVAAADRAIALRPNQPEGYFWKAANMGALAESFGLRQGLRYRGAIRDELETVLKLDPAFLQGSADRALGRWYYKVPGLFGGDKRKSEQHLRKALTFNPQSVITRLFLAETLIALDREVEARKELEAALAAPDDPEWIPEDRVFREHAKRLLATLQ